MMPDWIGDQLAGVGPEATQVFGRNAQTAAIPDGVTNGAKRPRADVTLQPGAGRSV